MDLVLQGNARRSSQAVPVTSVPDRPARQVIHVESNRARIRSLAPPA